MEQRAHSIEEIRDCWLTNRGGDGSDWAQALGAVYDLALAGERQRQIELLEEVATEVRLLDGGANAVGVLEAKLAELRKEAGEP